MELLARIPGGTPLGTAGEAQNIDFSKVLGMALPGVEYVPRPWRLFLSYLEVHSPHMLKNKKRGTHHSPNRFICRGSGGFARGPVLAAGQAAASNSPKLLYLIGQTRCHLQKHIVKSTCLA